MKIVCLGLSALLVAACGSSPHPAQSAATVKTPAKTAPAPASAVVTLKALVNGDAACYVTISTAAGDKDLDGSFELCPGGGADATKLIGKHITYTTKKGNVLAASCQGDMDCGKSDVVDIVDTITPAP